MKKLILTFIALSLLFSVPCFARSVQDAHKAVIGRMDVTCTPLSDGFLSDCSVENSHFWDDCTAVNDPYTCCTAENVGCWGLQGTPTTLEISTDQDHTGGSCSKSVKVITDAAWEGGEFRYTEPAPTNAVAYDVSVWVYVVSGEVQLFDTGGHCNIADGSVSATTGAWEELTGTCTGDGSAEGLKIISTATDAGVATYYIDDATITALFSMWTPGGAPDGETGSTRENYRLVVPAADISGCSGSTTQVRVKFQSHSTDDTYIDGASICKRSGSTDDCTAAPVALLFSTSASVKIDLGGNTQWTDWVNFSTDCSEDLLVHVWTDTGANNPSYIYNNEVGSITYYKDENVDYSGTQTWASDGTNAREAWVIEIEGK